MYRYLKLQVYSTNHSLEVHKNVAVAAYFHLQLPQKLCTAMHGEHVPYIQLKGRNSFLLELQTSEELASSPF